MASEVLVSMIVGVEEHFKQVIGYFLLINLMPRLKLSLLKML